MVAGGWFVNCCAVLQPVYVVSESERAGLGKGGTLKPTK